MELTINGWTLELVPFIVAILFGLWQQSWLAGLFMFFFVACFSNK